MSGSTEEIIVTTGIASPQGLVNKICKDSTFIHQGSNEDSEGIIKRLENLSSTYSRRRVKLGNVVNRVKQFSSLNNVVTAASLNAPDTEDSWTIDADKQLSLLLSKETYQRLGLVGSRCNIGSRADARFLVRIDVKNRDVSSLSHSLSAIAKWEEERASNGLLDWEVAFSPNALFDDGDETRSTSTTRSIQCRCRKQDDTHIPSPIIQARPQKHATHQQNESDEFVDWSDRTLALFEWVGMACLNSDRLRAFDHVDPYVAVYETPEPSSIGSLFHLRWGGDLGILPLEFVQSIIETTLQDLSSPVALNPGKDCFVAMTAQIHPNAQAFFVKGGNPITKTLKCWSLIASRDVATATGGEEDVLKEGAVVFNWASARTEK